MPSTGPQGLAPNVAISCWSVPEAECLAVAADVVDRLPAGHPEVASISVRAGPCAVEGCPDGLAARGGGDVWVEYVRGGGFVVFEVEAGPAGLAIDGPVDRGPSFVVEPTSDPMGVPAGRLSLGHCGLHSPIDFDTSLWDPIGSVDGDAPEAINATDGLIRLVDPVAAEFVADSGFIVRLSRHVGPRSLPACD
jgi:hypothetical protein